MIKAHCFTNLDKFKSTKWPSKFAALPRVGDNVKGRGGARDEHGHELAPEMQPSLRVVKVTFLETRDGEPMVEVELWYPPYMNAKGELAQIRPRKLSDMTAEDLQRIIRDGVRDAVPRQQERYGGIFD